MALHVVGQELASFSSILQPQKEPLFTRRITQQATTVAAPVPRPAVPAKPPAAPKVARSLPATAIPTLASDVTATQAAITGTETVTASVVPEPTPTVAPTAQPTPTVSLAQATPTAATSSVAAVSTTVNNPIASLAEQGDWPGSTRLNYKLSGYFRGELHGDARVQWSRDKPEDGDKYQVRIDVSVAFQKISMVSQGKVRAGGLQPEVFEENNRGRIRNLRLEAQEVVIDNGTRMPRPAADPLSVQDAASQFVELGHRFKNGRNRLAEGEVVRVWLARPGGLDEWVYDIGPVETVDLPEIGPVQAYHLIPRPLANPRGQIKAEIWFAPSLQYLPVRIKLIVNAETHLDLKVQEIIQ
jgi:hypothetical protein